MFLRLLLSKSPKIVQRSNSRTMKVLPIPANQDNYMYLIVDEESRSATIVDPVDVKSILKATKEQNVKLTSALVTHHHWDHAGGTAELKKAENVKIYGGDGERIEGIDEVVKDNQELQLGSLKVTTLKTPCHTSTHICYYVTDNVNGQKAVFTGDTLFIGGCGRFFEGTPEQMHQALNEKLANLPDDTLVYCGHEYTIKNLQFALTVEPHNENIKNKLLWAEKERASGRYTVPSKMGEEKTYNPFMRVESMDIQKKLDTLNDPLGTMQKLRVMKNNF